jgi:hypothetical protein
MRLIAVHHITTANKYFGDRNKKNYTVLVTVDFSPCSTHALKSSAHLMGREPDIKVFIIFMNNYLAIYKIHAYLCFNHLCSVLNRGPVSY